MPQPSFCKVFFDHVPKYVFLVDEKYNGDLFIMFLSFCERYSFFFDSFISPNSVSISFIFPLIKRKNFSSDNSVECSFIIFSNSESVIHFINFSLSISLLFSLSLFFLLMFLLIFSFLIKFCSFIILKETFFFIL